MELCLVRKTGGSLSITIPRWFVEQHDIEAGDKIWVDFSKSWIGQEKEKETNPRKCSICGKQGHDKRRCPEQPPFQRNMLEETLDKKMKEIREKELEESDG